MPTFRIWYVGTEDFAIEEARSDVEACQKTGRNAEECEVQQIPEEDIVWETQQTLSPPQFHSMVLKSRTVEP
jgi:hypothetical protein